MSYVGFERMTPASVFGFEGTTPATFFHQFPCMALFSNLKLFVHHPTVNISLISIQYCFDGSTVEVRFLLLQMQHSAGFVYGFIKGKWGTREVLTQHFSK